MAYKIKIIMLLLLTAVVTGCASVPETKYVTRVETVTVYKPVYTPPPELQNLPEINRPDLATNYLSAEDKQRPGHVVKTVVESIAQLRTYAEILEGRIEVYKRALEKPAEEVPEPTTTITSTESDKPFEE